MDLISRSLCQPCSHPGVFVSCVVIDNQVDIQIRRDAVIQTAQEREKLLMAVPRFALCKHCARRDIQCGEQSRCSIANVIVRHAFGITQTHRQHGLRTVQRLNLAFLIDAQHQRMIRRFRYRPAISRTFSTKNGSLDSLKVRVRCG